jgi:hypothetical protein
MNELLHRSNLALTNGNQPELVTFVNSVVDFIMANENGRVAEGWPRETLCQTVAYNMAKNTLLCEYKDGILDGILMWYKCNEGKWQELINKWLPDDPNGDSIYLTFLFANSKNSFRKLAINAISIEPDILTKKLLALRCKRGKELGEFVKYDLRLFNKILKLKD